MPRPMLTLQQQQLQQQRQMQQGQPDLRADRSRDVPARQDQAPRQTTPATQQNAHADQ